LSYQRVLCVLEKVACTWKKKYCGKEKKRTKDLKQFEAEIDIIVNMTNNVIDGKGIECGTEVK
jgi:hypothetical protein